MADGTFQSEVQKTFKMSEFHASIKDYYENMTGGKFIMKPHDDDENLKDGASFEPFTIKELGSK